MNVISKAKNFVANLFVDDEPEVIIEPEASALMDPITAEQACRTQKYLRNQLEKTNDTLQKEIGIRKEAMRLLEDWKNHSAKLEEELTNAKKYIYNLEQANTQLRQLYSKALDDKIAVQEKLSETHIAFYTNKIQQIYEDYANAEEI